jgi:hypothetical protein
MGDLAFGRSFGMLESGELHEALRIMHEGQKLLGYVTPLPWIVPILKMIPRAAAGEKRFRAWRKEQIEKRQKVGV